MSEFVGFTGCCGGNIFYSFEEYSPTQAEKSLLELQRRTMKSYGVTQVILKGSDNTRLTDTFIKLGWKRSFSDIRNPNTGNLLYGWYFDLTAFLKEETKPKTLTQKLFSDKKPT